MSGVTLKNAVKRFGDIEVIHGVDLDIDAGEFCVFVGPSGCGKSTLLRMIAGLEETTEGEIRIGGRDVTRADPAERGVAMVFQTYALYPHMTVEENMGFGLKMTGTPKAEVAAKVARAADILQLGPYLKRKPKALSGGQRQRVAIGRAITRGPDVFLFDEPLSNLDAELRVDMRVEISRLHKEIGATMIYVTHDQVEAMTLADKIVVLKDGRVMQIGTPMELYHEPANLFVAGFLGAPSMNFLKVTVEAVEGQTARVGNGALDPITVSTRGHSFAAGETAILGVRPQYLHPVADDEGQLHGSIVLTERLGAETIVEVTLKDGEKLIAALSEDRIYAPGERIGFDFDPDRALLFPTEG